MSTKHPAQGLAALVVALVLLVIVGQFVADATASIRPITTASQEG